MDSSSSKHRAERIRGLFDAAIEHDLKSRADYLSEACGSDFELYQEVEFLLKAHDEADSVLHRLDSLDTSVGGSRGAQPAEADGLVGQQVSHYRIQARLGGGGMGVVYRAVDTQLDRTVAIKFLPAHLSRDPTAKARFVREAKAASALDHVNIGYIHEIDQTDEGKLFIVMAFYEGESIKKKIARGPIPVAEALNYATQMAQGLSIVHAAGIVHRDIKPANVMVTTEAVVKLVDFGIAKTADASTTLAGTRLGTIAYMSPEQGLGQKVDHRTDLWSLGVVLYEMLTGELPERESSGSGVFKIRSDIGASLQSLRPEVTPAVADVVDKLLRKDHDERYSRAADVLADLRRARHPEATGVAGRAAGQSSPSRHLPRILRYGLVTVIVFLLAAVGFFFFTGGRVPIDSIAVLPLENMTGNPEQEYVADGMTEALISNLGQIKGLRRVISRTSVMQFKKTDKSLSEIGRTLDVAAIVEGSVRSYGNQVQIDVRLIEAETEGRLWEQRFTRATDDVLTLQNEVALAIARAVEVRMTATDEARLAEGLEVNPKVYDLYLRGLQARVDDARTRSQVIAYFEQAIAADSSFAPAYAALAIEYALASGFDMLPGGEVKAEMLAEKALALNPSLSEPYVALGLLHEAADWDWAGAEEAFRRAIERNPGDAFARHELSQLWMRMGRFEEALAQGKQALILDPLSSRYQSGVGEVYYFGGRYDEAIVELKKAHALNPRKGTEFLGLSYWQKGNYDEALEWWEASEGPFDVEYVEEGRARLAAVTGQREKAAAVVKEWEDGWSKGEYGKNIFWLIATVYADLGDKDKALDWLDRAYETRLGLLVYVKVDPAFYSLHGEPRFQALLEKMGLHRE